MNSWRGIWTAIVTPFLKTGTIDYNAYRLLLSKQALAKVTGVVSCGTTGESPTLTLDEKKSLISEAVQFFKGTGIKVMAGTGSNNTEDTIEFSKWASDNGADALLVVTPYYNKPTPPGIENHFLKIADAVNIPLCLYNVPGRTGVSIKPKTLLELAKHPRICGLKEASGDLTLTSEFLDILKSSRPDFEILSGDDVTFLPALSVGAVGVISVASNLIPEQLVALQQMAERGDFLGAQKLHQRLYPLFRDLFIETNPTPIKATLQHMGLCEEWVRPPLALMEPSNKEILLRSLKSCLKD